MIASDGFGTYVYHEIKDYHTCLGCQYFYDNWHEERFECLKEDRNSEDCFEPMMDDSVSNME